MADAMRGLAPQTVAGPTTGGVLLAYEVGRQLGLRGIFCERDEGGGRSFQRDFHLAPGERVLVVDDVLTSGGSIRDTIDAVRRTGAEPIGVAVVVDRAHGQVDFGLPFFAATEVDMESTTPEACPLCKQGVPLKIT
jgi:orotate phosphoribosyltransferase